MTTTRHEFERRFDEVVVRTTAYTSEQIGHPVAVPNRFVIAMRDVSGKELSRAETLDPLYLGPDVSYVFIDVGIHLGGKHSGAAWVRPSDHHPQPPTEVWDAFDIGPFKVIGGFGSREEWELAKRQGIPPSVEPRDIQQR